MKASLSFEDASGGLFLPSQLTDTIIQFFPIYLNFVKRYVSKTV
jgi:hypothetical protein